MEKLVILIGGGLLLWAASSQASQGNDQRNQNLPGAGGAPPPKGPADNTAGIINGVVGIAVPVVGLAAKFIGTGGAAAAGGGGAATTGGTATVAGGTTAGTSAGGSTVATGGTAGAAATESAVTAGTASAVSLATGAIVVAIVILAIITILHIASVITDRVVRYQKWFPYLNSGDAATVKVQLKKNYVYKMNDAYSYYTNQLAGSVAKAQAQSGQSAGIDFNFNLGIITSIPKFMAQIISSAAWFQPIERLWAFNKTIYNFWQHLDPLEWERQYATPALSEPEFWQWMDGQVIQNIGYDCNNQNTTYVTQIYDTANGCQQLGQGTKFGFNDYNDLVGFVVAKFGRTKFDEMAKQAHFSAFVEALTICSCMRDFKGPGAPAAPWWPGDREFAQQIADFSGCGWSVSGNNGTYWLQDPATGAKFFPLLTRDMQAPFVIMPDGRTIKNGVLS